MYCKLDTAVIEITRSFESEYNNSPQFEIYTENRYMGTLSLAIASISILIANGDETKTWSSCCHDYLLRVNQIKWMSQIKVKVLHLRCYTKGIY